MDDAEITAAPKKRKSGIPTGNAREYFVMGEMLRRGFDAQLADRNPRRYDLLVGRAEEPTLRKVQVKTVRSQPWYGQRMIFIECEHRHLEQLLWPLESREELPEVVNGVTIIHREGTNPWTHSGSLMPSGWQAAPAPYGWQAASGRKRRSNRCRILPRRASSITAATISPFDSRAGYRRRTDSINPVSQLSCVGVMVVQTTGQGKNPDRGGCPF